MKKIFLLLLLSFVFVSGVHAQTPDTITGEHIKTYTSNITINKDGTIDVQEHIQYDFADLDKHGIYRDIPFVRHIENKKYKLEFSNFSVQDENGKDYQYKKTSTGEFIELKIGDPDRTVTGIHNYIISYHVGGVLSYLKDHDELYWNATGNDWKVPISNTTSVVNLPEALSADQLKTICYTGYSGSTDQNCTGTVNGNTVTFSTTTSLAANEGLTEAVSFPKGTVAVLQAQEYKTFFETPLGQIVLVCGVIVGVLLIIFWYIIYPILIPFKWFLNGRDPDVGKAVTAWFDPPKTPSGRPLAPAETGALIDESADLKDIVSTIVDLARRGYMKIEERKKKDFYFIRSDKTTGLQPFESSLLDGMFGSESEIHVKDKDFYKTFDSVKKQIIADLMDEGFFPKDFAKTKTFYTVIGSLALTTLNFPLALVAFIFGRNMTKKTVQGAEAAKVAQGLKNFLSSQERQLEFQAEKQMFFEKLLPFAVAFGVEEIWAKRFETLGIKQPDWYTGYYGSSFTTSSFVSSLHSSASVLGSVSAPPSSSGSGFSSGSSGGGGGGGGGGSW